MWALWDFLATWLAYRSTQGSALRGLHVPSHLGEDAVYNAICQRVVAISQQVLFTDVEVMVCIKLPELHHSRRDELRLCSVDISLLSYAGSLKLGPEQLQTVWCSSYKDIAGRYALEAHLAIDHIEVLIGKVAKDFVDIVLLV